MKPKTVAIFGVFDGIHDGHLAFIHEARTHGEQLVAIVARDSVVLKLKGRLPVHDEVKRILMLLEVPEIDLVFLGDPDEGTYKTLKKVNPQVIFLGYDQQALFDSISMAMKEGFLSEMELIYGTPHKPETFKSSIINS
jgi:FAD synthetase